MATKKISLYSNLESTHQQQVEDLYLIVDNKAIVLIVKNKKTNQFVALEHFVNDAREHSWHDLIAYLQTNSRLMNVHYDHVHFVYNSPQFILTNKLKKEDTLIYQDELNMVHEKLEDEELYITPFNENLVIVFTVPDALSTNLSRLFPSGKWHHYTEYILATAGEEEVLIYLFDSIFCIKIVKEGKTQFIHYYTIDNHDRNCYDILNACSNANIKTNLTKLKIWGYDIIQHSFMNKLAPYFLSGEIVETPNEEIGATINLSQPQNNYSTYFIF